MLYLCLRKQKVLRIRVRSIKHEMIRPPRRNCLCFNLGSQETVMVPLLLFRHHGGWGDSVNQGETYQVAEKTRFHSTITSSLPVSQMFLLLKKHTQLLPIKYKRGWVQAYVSISCDASQTSEHHSSIRESECQVRVHNARKEQLFRLCHGQLACPSLLPALSPLTVSWDLEEARDRTETETNGHQCKKHALFKGLWGWRKSQTCFASLWKQWRKSAVSWGRPQELSQD